MTLIKKYGPPGREYGFLLQEKGTKIYHSYRSRQKHFMRKYQAWGIQCDVIMDLAREKCDLVSIEIDGEGTLEVPFSVFTKESIIAEFYPHGEQAFLPECRMRWVQRMKTPGQKSFRETRL